MNKKVLTFILTSIWLLLWATTSIASVTEYQKAVDAYNREDYKTAHKLFLKLAKQGVVKAQYNLGLMYGKGKGVAKNYNKAIKWWNFAANQGNGKAQINLGWMYEMGKGVPKDAQKAANWYQLASNQGLAKAQEKLNLLLNKTIEHLQENTASSKEFKSLKEKSSKDIKNLQKATASLRSELNQIKSEKAKAIEATNQANAKARQEQLASSEEFESLKEKTSKDIKDLQAANASLHSELNQIKSEKANIIEATNQTNAKARQEQLASSEEFESLKEKTSKDIKDLQAANASLHSELNQIKSEKANIIEATNQTNAKARQEQLASSEEFKSLKEKTSKDIKDLQAANASLHSELNQIKSEKANIIEATNQTNAKASQEQLASISDNPSELNTGSVSFRGDTFEIAINLLGKKEFATAHQMFLVLADKGNAEAQINLGMMFENGQGVSQDFNEAIGWYRLAADQGLTEAQEKLNLLLNKRAEAQISFGLGMRFESGQGVPQDINEAIRRYRIAADLGMLKAKEKLNLLLNKPFSETTAIDKTTQATNQAKVKAKEEKLASIRKLESLKEKYSTETRNLKATTASLHSELEKIKGDIADVVEATNRANDKASEVVTSKELMSKYLDKWVRAWEKQDIELYLSFYSKEFKGSKERHADWRISRQTALKRHTNISIQLQNIKISKSKYIVEINFTQTFKSDEYSDIGIKELIWIKNGSAWRIFKETWMPTNN